MRGGGGQPLNVVISGEKAEKVGVGANNIVHHKIVPKVGYAC